MPEKNISFNLFTNIENLPKHLWQKIENSSIFSSYDFLAFTANINPTLQHRWIIVNVNNEPVGGLYFQLVNFKGEQLKNYLPEKEKSFINSTIQNLADCFLDKVNWKLAVLGNVFITGENGQYWQPQISSIEKWELLKKAIKHLKEFEPTDAVLITDIYNNSLKGSEVLEKKGFRMFGVEPDMIFNVLSNWLTFDDYLVSVSSKYRVRAKKVLEKSANLTVINASAEDIQAHEQILFSLYKNVVDKADFKLAEITPQYLLKCKQNFPEQFVVKMYMLNNQPLGFISYFINRDCLDIHLVGLDYNYNKDNCIYQRILYNCIADGIALQKQNIHFGRTASIIKSAVGAKPTPVFSFLKHSSSISNMAIKPLTNYLKPEPFQARNPYKN